MNIDYEYYLSRSRGCAPNEGDPNATRSLPQFGTPHSRTAKKELNAYFARGISPSFADRYDSSSGGEDEEDVKFEQVFSPTGYSNRLSVYHTLQPVPPRGYEYPSRLPVHQPLSKTAAAVDYSGRLVSQHLLSQSPAMLQRSLDPVPGLLTPPSLLNSSLLNSSPMLNSFEKSLYPFSASPSLLDPLETSTVYPSGGARNPTFASLLDRSSMFAHPSLPRPGQSSMMDRSVTSLSHNRSLLAQPSRSLLAAPLGNDRPRTSLHPSQFLHRNSLSINYSLPSLESRHSLLNQTPKQSFEKRFPTLFGDKVEKEVVEPEGKTSKTGSKLILEPSFNDVLLGRGGMGSQHFGNITFLKMIDIWRDTYETASSKLAKASIISTIIDVVRNDQKGRFLDPYRGQDGTKGWLENTDDKRVREKVVTAFRSMRHRKKRKCKSKWQKQKAILKCEKDSTPKIPKYRCQMSRWKQLPLHR